MARRGRGTRKALAAFLHVHPSTINHYLAGDYKWQLETISAVAAFFDAPPGWPLVNWDIAERVFPKR